MRRPLLGSSYWDKGAGRSPRTAMGGRLAGCRYVGCNWDLRRFGEPDRVGSSQAIDRRLGSEKQLAMFTSLILKVATRS